MTRDEHDNLDRMPLGFGSLERGKERMVGWREGLFIWRGRTFPSPYPCEMLIGLHWNSGSSTIERHEGWTVKEASCSSVLQMQSDSGCVALCHPSIHRGMGMG